jgi:hypothetical protein
MNMENQPSALRKIVVGQPSLVVRRWSFATPFWPFATRVAYNLFKHKNAPAMLPEHWLYLMADS